MALAKPTVTDQQVFEQRHGPLALCREGGGGVPINM